MENKIKKVEKQLFYLLGAIVFLIIALIIATNVFIPIRINLEYYISKVLFFALIIFIVKFIQAIYISNSKN